MKYDVEKILDDIESLLKEKLNAQLQSIAAEKDALGKTVDTPEILETSYFQQTWSDNILNVTPAIFYGVDTIQATGNGPTTLEVFKIFVEVVYIDSGMDTNGKRRLLRYSRAIKEVFEKNFDALPWANKINIETIRPLAFTLDTNTSEEVRVGGVSITTALA